MPDKRTPRIRRSGAFGEIRGQLALGSTDGAASEAAGVEAAGTDGATVVGVGW